MKGRGLLLLGVPSAYLSLLAANSPVALLSPVDQFYSCALLWHCEAILFPPAMPYMCSGTRAVQRDGESTVTLLSVWLGTAIGTAGTTGIGVTPSSYLWQHPTSSRNE